MADSNNVVYILERYRLDPVNRSFAALSGEAFNLPPKVFDTLVFLVQNAGRVVGKDELMDHVWPGIAVEENNLSQNISALRRLFGERPGDRRYIETVAGRGFRFVAEVHVEADDNSRHNDRVGVKTPLADAEGPVAAKALRRVPLLYAVALVVLVAATAFFVYRTFLAPRYDRKITSIAVLPFKPLVAEQNNAPLELGITDTLIWKLSGGDLTVFPLSSVRRFASLDQDPAAAGREIGADAVLDGRLAAVDDRIRVTAQLIRVADGKQLWAGQFDENAAGILEVQDSISAKVASELKVRLGENDKKRYTENVRAYELYLRGRFLSQSAQAQEIRTGIQNLNQALELDGNFVPAYVGLADSYRAQVLIEDVSPAEAMPKALLAANRAVALDDTYAGAHAMLGWLKFWYDWDWLAAEEELKLAIRIDPANSDAHQFYAHLLSNTGRHEEALAEAREALEVEPLSLRANSFLGMFLSAAGRTDEAISQFDSTLAIDPNYRLALMFSAKASTVQGDFESALTKVRKAQKISGGAGDPVAVEAVALAKAGNIKEARRTLDQFLTESSRRYVSPYNIALVQLALGERAAALNSLEKAYAEKDVRMVFLKIEPNWDGLRSEPRFVELMRRMNFASSNS